MGMPKLLYKILPLNRFPQNTIKVHTYVVLKSDKDN